MYYLHISFTKIGKTGLCYCVVLCYWVCWAVAAINACSFLYYIAILFNYFAILSFSLKLGKFTTTSCTSCFPCFWLRLCCHLVLYYFFISLWTIKYKQAWVFINQPYFAFNALHLLMSKEVVKYKFYYSLAKITKEKVCLLAIYLNADLLNCCIEYICSSIYFMHFLFA